MLMRQLITLMLRGKTDLSKEPAATSGVKISQLFG